MVQPSALSVFVAVVFTAGLGATAAAIRIDGLVMDVALAVLLVLAVLTWWQGSIGLTTNSVSLSFSSIVLVASMALLGPAGAGIVGILVGPLQRGKQPWRARLFNTGMFSLLGVFGGVVYRAAGGVVGGAGLTGPWEIARAVGLPILVADVAQALANLLLIAMVVRLAQGVPMRTQIWRLLVTSGPNQLGYGVIAFILVVLWEPVGLGPFGVVLVLPPLLVARWAFNQYSDEVKGHERALGVLVGAVESKAPHLAGHSARVAQLSVHMAESLGLRPAVVADIRAAGMLHDLGLTTLPTATVRRESVGASVALGDYPQRGARLVQEVGFLAGSVDAVAHHREAVGSGAEGAALGLPALVVGLADEYDLLTEVGSPDGRVLTHDEAMAALRARSPDDHGLLPTLEQALVRRANVAGA
ncbi:HD domain-containing phosphohydrolase [Ornithinibacter sp.]|uniref:HD-GYP domain-containing protein n=1 Tax=Ornithinibacter sp. TaxID=2862748 RepID=UPI002CCAF30F|nr:HD domain-containing phosphohydrolase [Ornithinibacter sp.]MBU9943203.1 HD domain-containing protein [Dermatophilaceae bacterium]HQX86121.1 HD domain-containing protein [Ornithinibacter sp.]HRA24844.1 HD domain-containing protein [Ornithinibacter sp.]